MRNRSTIHLFYIESYFHYLMAEGIIDKQQLSKNDILFITHRGVVVGDEYKDRVLYDGTTLQFGQRLLWYLKNRKELKEQLKGKKIISYAPFQFYYPGVLYFSEYNIIEEGFSAYSKGFENNNWKGRLYEIAKCAIINLLFPFSGKNEKGLLLGLSYSSKFPKDKMKLYVFSDKSYGNFDFGPKIIREVIRAHKPTGGCPISDSWVLVMDRLNPHGRPFDDEIYLKVLTTALQSLGLGERKIYVKLHPSDVKLGEAERRVSERLQSVGLSSEFITMSLEEIASSNQNNCFVGTNSTSLFYAPIFGNSNVSYSFARLLAEEDNEYESFLEGWGGVKSFVELFSNNVKCL